MGLGSRGVSRLGGEVVPWGPSSGDVVRLPFCSGLFVPHFLFWCPRSEGVFMGLGSRGVSRFGGEVVPWGPSSSDAVRVPFFPPCSFLIFYPGAHVRTGVFSWGWGVGV